MNCEKMGIKLIAYLDGNASAGERREVEAHLADCGACRTRAEEYRRLWTALEGVPDVEPSLTFDARMRQRIAAEPKPKFWGWFVPSPRLALSLALLLVLSCWLAVVPTDLGPGSPAAQSDQDFKMIKDLRVLEDYDVLTKFDALSELPPAQPVATPPAQKQDDKSTM
jgi:anti-sigma factor RsiW